MIFCASARITAVALVAGTFGACARFDASDPVPASSGGGIDASAADGALPGPPELDGGHDADAAPSPACVPPTTGFFDDFERDGLVGEWTTAQTAGTIAIASRGFCGGRNLFVTTGAGKLAMLQRDVIINAARLRWSFLLKAGGRAQASGAQVHLARLVFNDSPLQNMLFLHLQGSRLILAEQPFSGTTSYIPHDVAGFVPGTWQQIEVELEPGPTPHVRLKLGSPGAPELRLDEDLELPMAALKQTTLGVSYMTADATVEIDHDAFRLVSE